MDTEGEEGGEKRHDLHLQVGPAAATTQYNPWVFARTPAEAIQISRSVRARLRTSTGNRGYAYYKVRKALCAYWKAKLRKETAWKD